MFSNDLVFSNDVDDDTCFLKSPIFVRGITKIAEKRARQLPLRARFSHECFAVSAPHVYVMLATVV